MVTQKRLTGQRLKVLDVFLQGVGVELSGADVMRLTGMASGSLYPILYAFEEAGLLESRWESTDPQVLGRPKRRLYRVTAIGEQAARDALGELPGFARLFAHERLSGR